MHTHPLGPCWGRERSLYMTKIWSSNCGAPNTDTDIDIDIDPKSVSLLLLTSTYKEVDIDIHLFGSTRYR